MYNQKYPPHILELIKKSQEKARQLREEIQKQKDLEKYKTKEIANLSYYFKEIANFFWTGELSELEIRCIKSFVQKNFHVKLWSYENLKVDGAESCDASLVLPKNDLTKYKQRRGDSNLQETSSAFSDAFRFNLINKFGGWWFDTDCFCLKSAEDFYELRKGKSIVAGLESLGYPYVGSAAFYANNKVCNLFINELEKTCTEYNYNFPLWGLIGPLLITKVVHDNKLYNEVLLHDCFFSIDFRRCDLFLKSDLNKLAKSYIKESYLTHVWHSSGLYKNMEKGSLLNELINNTYTNNEIVDKDLLNKQNNFRNRFIEISNLYHKVLKRSPSNNELIRYVTTNDTIEQIENKLLN
jgi:hypothetical protein